MAQLVYFVVDSRVLFYVCVGAGDIRLRLIIVVIGNKILHCIFGKEFSELTAKLCGKGLVVCQH